jgi:hypothetical protein
MRLELGKFYESKDGNRWCCFKVNENAPSHAAAYCVNIETNKVEYFYLDGRYDEYGIDNYTLIKENV